MVNIKRKLLILFINIYTHRIKKDILSHQMREIDLNNNKKYLY